MIVLGLKCYSHDTGAAIVTDRTGELEIVAISEARLNRRKHSFAYPLMAIDYCLRALGLDSLDQVDAVCIDRHMEVWPEARSQFGYENARKRHHPRYDDNHRWNYLIEQTLRLDRAKIAWINHVDAHAASAYYVSPFDAAAVLIAEGGTGIYKCAGTDMTALDRIGYLGDTYSNGQRLPKRRDHFVNSSFFYDKVSALLGYDVFGAGQTMALAGFADQFARRDLIDVDTDRFDEFIINHDKTVFGMDRLDPFEGDQDAGLVSEHWVNLARQAQETLEQDILYLVERAQSTTGAKNLCLAGGAALNCIINGKILRAGLFDDLYIQPAASDEGIPLGCALHGYYGLGGQSRREMSNAYLGKENDPAEIDGATARWGVTARPATTADVADLLAAEKIVGRVAEGSEYGPRALGNRSILANPRPANMKDRLNAEIKHRERFRPFAPSCLEDRVPPFFDSPGKSPFMIIAGNVQEDARDKVPAVTHADGSCRVQTVNRDQNAGYYDLIEAFGDRTGCYVLTNTSFNDQGEPIVETYDDAISCFLRTGLDALYLDGKLIERDAATPKLDPDNHAQNIAADVSRRYADLIADYCDMEAYVDLGERLKAEEEKNGDDLPMPA